MITLKEIKANKGATLNYDGDAVTYKTGFQVSKRDLDIIPLYKLRKYQIIEVLSWIDRADCLGIWIDNNKVYIDVSERIANRAHALKVGRERNQISIWAWRKGEAVNC